MPSSCRQVRRQETGRVHDPVSNNVEQSRESGIPSVSVSFLLVMVQGTVAPAATTRPVQVLLDWTQPLCAASETA